MARKQKETLIRTENRKRLWLTRMLRLAQSSIKWEGLPDYLDLTYLEGVLIRTGSAILVYDNEVGRYFIGQNASTGAIDIDGYPINRSLIFRNGQQIWCDPEDSVIIYNNALRCSDLWLYEMLADDMCQMDMAVRVNISTQKTMPMIPTREEKRLTVENIMNALDDNMPYLLLDANNIDVEAFKASLLFDNKRSFTADNITQVQREWWNRTLTLIGINNVNVEKRERVNTMETSSNLDEIATMRRDRLNAREYACKRMKLKFGLNVKVSYYSDIVAGERGDGNGTVYDRGERGSLESVSAETS